MFFFDVWQWLRLKFCTHSIKWDATPDGYQIKDTTAGPNSPDLELLWFPLLTGDLSGDPPKGAGITIGAVVLKQEGSGEIKLKTTSVYDQPAIDHKCVYSETQLGEVMYTQLS